MRAISLLGVLVLAKICTLAGRDLALSAWAPVAYFWQDFLIVLLFAGLDFLVRRPKLAWSFYAAIVLYIAVNVPIARVLSTPLTWPLLRAAGAPLSDSIAYYLTWRSILVIALVLAAATLLPFLLQGIKPRILIITSAVLIPFCLMGPFATRQAETLGLHRNAFIALVETASPSVPAKADMGDPRVSFSQNEPMDDLSQYRGAAAGRNLILVSLESTAAQYLHPYGAKEDPMPHLTVLSQQALLFQDAYAVYPESIKGLLSVLCSTYPAIHTPPEVYGKLTSPSLAAVLADAGYRTGLFHSGRFAYLGMKAVVRNRGYHVTEDAGDIGGHHHSSFGVDEPSAVGRVLSWLDGLPQGQRFFVTYLPVAGHHPYETPGTGPFPESDELGRYRNALHYADSALDALVRGLQDRGLYQKTLWVIFGDHGEAFGQHKGNFGHTLFIYDENIRVPLLIIAPGLLQEQVRVRRVASLLDTAPTVLDLLGLPWPAAYQGRSLLEGQPRMALFFTDYSLRFLGLRDGRWKFVHELDSGRSKLFDMQEDPAETIDLSRQRIEQVMVYRQRLLRWCGSQREWIVRSN